jgi:transcriptional regulator with XRE-family HTH domain
VTEPRDEIREQLRESLRDGLREEAAPISRRLAEVKGLSNNAIRRLENIETTIESERNARVDDLALLVELLTEGWRTMNARLDRIEAALEPAATNVVSLRESA